VANPRADATSSAAWNAHHAGLPARDDGRELHDVAVRAPRRDGPSHRAARQGRSAGTSVPASPPRPANTLARISSSAARGSTLRRLRSRPHRRFHAHVHDAESTVDNVLHGIEVLDARLRHVPDVAEQDAGSPAGPVHLEHVDGPVVPSSTAWSLSQRSIDRRAPYAGRRPPRKPSSVSPRCWRPMPWTSRRPMGAAMASIAERYHEPRPRPHWFRNAITAITAAASRTASSTFHPLIGYFPAMRPE